MSGYLKPYKSYIFRDKDPVIDILRTAVKDSGLSYTEVHDLSGVATGTLTAWFAGTTKRPQFATINAVARGLGKEFVGR
jgi:transcriptional regulator with XRE-family HTH domain